MHVVGPKSFIDAVVGKFIDADKERVCSLGDLEGIADMIPVGMGQDDEISSKFSRLHRRCRVVVKKRINEENVTVVGCDLK